MSHTVARQSSNSNRNAPEMSDSNCPSQALSDHDRSVLNAIFNPAEIGGDLSQLSAECDADELPAQLLDVSDDAELTADLIESQRLEAAAVQHSEAADWTAALQRFGEAILLTPARASLFNNRAQTHRLMDNDDAAMADLNEAVRLSGSAGRSGCRALCQRGLLWRRRNAIDAAKADFAVAARLGSQFARSQLIELNPYAALCNQMLQQAFKQLS